MKKYRHGYNILNINSLARDSAKHHRDIYQKYAK